MLGGGLRFDVQRLLTDVRVGAEQRAVHSVMPYGSRSSASILPEDDEDEAPLALAVVDLLARRVLLDAHRGRHRLEEVLGHVLQGGNRAQGGTGDRGVRALVDDLDQAGLGAPRPATG